MEERLEHLKNIIMAQIAINGQINSKEAVDRLAKAIDFYISIGESNE